MDGMLSQEEINALLGGLVPEEPPVSDTSSEEILTDVEKDAIGEISNISMGTAATTLSSLVNQRVVITTPVVAYSTWDEIADSYDKPCVFIQIYYTDGLDGNNILILKDSDVKIIADLMMGGDGTNTEEGELTDFHLSAISEAMNQMMGSSATSVSTMLSKPINITPPKSEIVSFDEKIEGEQIADFLKDKFVKVSFNMQIGNLVDSVLMQLYPFEFARDLYKQFIGASQAKEEIPEPVPVPQAVPQPVPQQVEQAVPQPVPQPEVQPMMQQQPMQQQQPAPYSMPVMQDVNVQNAQFVPFSQPSIQKAMPENIDLLMDVSLEVVAELGRTTKSIKDILGLSPGSIIELNRLVGESIDVVVSGKLVAKGEVVVIEEIFGIRITDIINN